MANLTRFIHRNGTKVALLTVKTNRGRNTGVMTGELSKGDVTQKMKVVLPISLANKALYCARHNCNLVLGEDKENITDFSRSSKWNKVAWVLELMQTYDYVIWMDLDTVFQSDVDIMAFVDPSVDIHWTKVSVQ
jgi:hypothetical protein